MFLPDFEWQPTHRRPFRFLPWLAVIAVLAWLGLGCPGWGR